jgi:hypothetical protein
MNIHIKSLVLAALLFFGCAHAEVKNIVVLDYNDFGPQATAYELLGMDWLQWQLHGDSRPKSTI